MSDMSDSSGDVDGGINFPLLASEFLVDSPIQYPQSREVLHDLSPEFHCDGISSIIALAHYLDVSVLDGTTTWFAAGAHARLGSGAFATASLTRLWRDVSQEDHPGIGTWPEPPPMVPASLLARGRTAGQKVVVKRFFTDDVERDDRGLAEIFQELRILGHKYLREHPNIVELIGLDWERNSFDILGGPSRLPVLLLEYGDCGTLKDFFCLQGIEYSWGVKVDLLYDIASGLEALFDAGVCHGDLKPTNVLVFRTGETSFTAKICDFGSAVIGVDVPTGANFRLQTITPPWDAPESAADIELEELEKVDVYTYGLIVCQVALHGGNPFASALSGLPAANNPVAERAIIREWKMSDKVSEICCSAIRDASDLRYSSSQYEILSNLINCTVRTCPSLRADEYSDIKMLLKPNETEDNDWGPENPEMLQVIRHRLIPPPFNCDWRESVPSILRCWTQLRPNGMLGRQILGDMEELASFPPAQLVVPGWESRVSEAKYELALGLIQGFGCDEDISHGCDLLIQSVASDCDRAMRSVFRILAAMGKDLPEEYHEGVALAAQDDAVKSCNRRRMQDLARLSPEMYDETVQRMRTNLDLSMDIFGFELVNAWDLQQDCDSIWAKIGGHNSLIATAEELADEGCTWLHYAASRGWTELVERLVQSPGCDVNCVTTEDHWTPILMACQGGHHTVFKVLLYHGADPAMESAIGGNCIHHLQRFSSETVGYVAAELVSRGIHVDSRCPLTGLTPLAAACSLGVAPDSIGWVSTLVRLGADILSKGDKNLTPVDMVAMRLEPDLLEILLQSPLLSEDTKSTACVNAVTSLIRQPFVSRMEHAGSAYQSNLSRVVDILLSPPVLATYASALYDACIAGAADLVPLLLDKGLQVDGPPSRGARPLLAAMYKGYVGIVRTLVDRGADITATDSNGLNILHVVAAFLPSFLPDVLTLLESRGCNIHELVNAGTDDLGLTPFDLAVRAENFECATSLVKLGAQYTEFTRRGGRMLGGNHLLFSSLFYSATSTAKLGYFLRLDPPPSIVVANNGMTLFHTMAAAFDAWSSQDTSPANNVAFLLDNKEWHEDAARPAQDGTTPLHLAALNLNVAVARVLLQVSYVNVNAVDKRRETPLDQLAIHELGLHHGAPDEFRPNSDMERHLARGRLETMRALLLKHGGV